MGAGDAVEEGAEAVGGGADAGGVEEDDLEVGGVVDAADGAPGGLGDGGDDGYGFAEHGVQEGGFACVGAADDGNQGFRHGVFTLLSIGGSSLSDGKRSK